MNDMELPSRNFRCGEGNVAGKATDVERITSAVRATMP